MLGLKLIHVSKRGPWNIPAPAPEGESFKALFLITLYIYDIIVIIINEWYATISGVVDENIDDVGNLHE